MIPLSDDNSRERSTPIVTYVLIALNILFFFFELVGGETFVENWAFVPSRFIANPISNIPTIFTAMFMHAGWAHLIGNMIYLWIFGDNVEDYYGKVKFLIFYLICGVAATFAQFVFTTASSLPNLGASGAIAGVLGSYILLWPKGKINVLLFQSITQLPAILVIGFWFVLQFLSGIGSLASTDSEQGGVAYMAHIGGFLAGLFIAVIFRIFQKDKPT